MCVCGGGGVISYLLTVNPGNALLAVRRKADTHFCESCGIVQITEVVNCLDLASLGIVFCTREMTGELTRGLAIPRRVSLRDRAIVAATWNVRSLVERAGCDRRICRSRPEGQAQQGLDAVDRKLDLTMKELRRYQVSVAAVQETKWFGKDMWESQGYTFLHSGHRLPSGEGTGRIREGVGIALDKGATAAWKEAGEVWNAVSSRTVTARLKASREDPVVPGRQGISIFLLYQSTFLQPRPHLLLRRGLWMISRTL